MHFLYSSEAWREGEEVPYPPLHSNPMFIFSFLLCSLFSLPLRIYLVFSSSLISPLSIYSPCLLFSFLPVLIFSQLSPSLLASSSFVLCLSLLSFASRLFLCSFHFFLSFLFLCLFLSPPLLPLISFYYYLSRLLFPCNLTSFYLPCILHFPSLFFSFVPYLSSPSLLPGFLCPLISASFTASGRGVLIFLPLPCFPHCTNKVHRKKKNK